MAVDLFPVVERDKDRIAVCGFVNRHSSLTLPLRHLTVNIIVGTFGGRRQNPIVLFHKRCSHKDVDPDKLDIAGGHVTLNDFFFQGLDWNGPSLIAQASEFTARREAREEIRAKRPVKFEKEHFHRFQRVGHFHVESVNKSEDGEETYNYEYSTVYVVVLNPRKRIWFVDECPKCPALSEAIPLGFGEMRDRFMDRPDQFADGSSRILWELVEHPPLARKLLKLLKTATPRV